MDKTGNRQKLAATMENTASLSYFTFSSPVKAENLTYLRTLAQFISFTMKGEEGFLRRDLHSEGSTNKAKSGIFSYGLGKTVENNFRGPL